MFDDIFTLLWQYNEIIIVILVALVVFIVLTIVARFNG
jgi:hypothetical protein